jgi:hypothetical protein
MVVVASVVGLALVGGGAVWLFHPFAAVARPQSPPHATPSSTVTPVAATNCPVPPEPRIPSPSTPAPSGALPATIWVNVPLGVNLRVGPSATSQRLATLPQGTKAAVMGQETGGDGSLWYQVNYAAQTGWVKAEFVVTAPIQGSVPDGGGWGGAGWSLMVPDGYYRQGSGLGMAQFGPTHQGLSPFLLIYTSPPLAALPPPIPFVMNGSVPPVVVATTAMSVWGFSGKEQVTHLPLDTCHFALTADGGGGWAYVTGVFVTTPTRAYELLFLTETPDSPLVGQVLASLTLV